MAKIFFTIRHKINFHLSNGTKYGYLFLILLFLFVVFLGEIYCSLLILAIISLIYRNILKKKQNLEIEKHLKMSSEYLSFLIFRDLLYFCYGKIY